jgi:hypothetical protein
VRSIRRFILVLATLSPLLLAGCDLLGIETPEQQAARREADGKAIGGGCRHAGRSVEECYQLNRRAERAAVFAGWKEMHEYMAENKIEAQPPVAAASAPAAADDKATETSEAAQPAASAGATRVASRQPD